jgi:hypothetical protein
MISTNLGLQLPELAKEGLDVEAVYSAGAPEPKLEVRQPVIVVREFSLPSFFRTAL